MPSYDEGKFFLVKPDDSSTEHGTTIVSSTGTATLGYYGLGPATLLQELKAIKAPDDHPIYSLVGRVASDWAHVEHLFDEMIWHLGAKDVVRGASITAQMTGVASRCRAIIGLLTTIGKRPQTNTQSLISKTEELMNKSYGPSDRRNRIVHDPWYVYTGLNQTAQFKAMPHKDLRYGVHPVDFTELNNALTEIKNYSDRVTKLRDDILKLTA
jgi:hypothetical protein